MQFDKQQERLRQSGATMRSGPPSLLAKVLAVVIGAALLVVGFAVSLVIIIITFAKDELPRRGDLRWLLSPRAVLGKHGEEPPGHRAAPASHEALVAARVGELDSRLRHVTPISIPPPSRGARSGRFPARHAA